MSNGERPAAGIGAGVGGGAGRGDGGAVTVATGPSFSASATIWPRSRSICLSSSRALNS